MANGTTQTLTTLVPPLSPLLTYGPCLSTASSSSACNWTTGWKQGWDNDGAWSGLSERFAEGWAVGGQLTVEAELYGTGFSILLSPTSFYNLTLSLNSTVRLSLPSLEATTSANVTGLPPGLHSVQLAFESVDADREPDADEWARLTGVEVHDDGASVSTSTIDDALFFSGVLSLSSGWNLLSTSNPTSNVLNSTEATVYTPLLSSAFNSSLSWTDEANATVSLSFDGTSIELYAPVSQELGAFVPTLDGAVLAQVDGAANVGPDDDGITGWQLVWTVGGLETGAHELELKNVGAAGGGGGRLAVDYFRVGASTATSSSSSTLLSSTASTAASASSSSSSSAGTSSSSASSAGDISTSASIGIYIAAAVGGLALLGLMILTFFKWRRRRSSSTAGLTNGSAGPGGAGGTHNRRASANLLSPSTTAAEDKARPFQPLVGGEAGMREVDGRQPPPIWAARQQSLRRPSASPAPGDGGRAPHEPAYEHPIDLPLPKARAALHPGGASADPARPSIVSFGAATQVSTTLRDPSLLPPSARPKSSAAEIGDFGEAPPAGGSSGSGGGGLVVPREEGGAGNARDSRSVYSDDLSSALPSPVGGNPMGHGQSVYSLGQYYDSHAEPSPSAPSFATSGEDDDSRPRASLTMGAWDGRGAEEAGEAPLTPTREEAPGARRRYPTADGKGTPDTFGNGPRGNYF